MAQTRHPSTGLSGTDQSAALGRLPITVGPLWDIGTVSGYDPVTQTYTVDCSSGTQPTSARRVVDHPGNVSVLAVGTEVLLCRAFQRGPHILGVIQGNDPMLRVAPTPTESGEVPGDNVMRSMGGATVAALASGVAALSGSGGVGVFADGPGERLSILSSTLDEVTSGSSRGVEFHNGQMNYFARFTSTRDGDDVVYLDIGSKGDLINLRVAPTPGQDTASIRIGLSGAMDVTLRDGCNWYVTGGDFRLTNGSAERIITGDYVEEVVGAHTSEAGARKVLSASVIDASAGGRSTTTAGDSFTRVEGSVRTQAVGSAYNEYAAGVEWVTGDPRTGVPTPGALQALINYVGDTTIVNVLPGKSFNVVTTGAGTINLGVPGGAIPNPAGGHSVTAVPGVFSVTKYEPLSILIEALVTWLDTHVHATPGAVALPPSRLVVSPLVAALQSQTVKVGPL